MNLHFKRKLVDIPEKYVTVPGYCVRSSNGSFSGSNVGAKTTKQCKESCENSLKCNAYSPKVDNSRCYLHYYYDFKGANKSPTSYTCYLFNPKNTEHMNGNFDEIKGHYCVNLSDGKYSGKNMGYGGLFKC